MGLAIFAAAGLALVAPSARAQSAADLRSRLTIDGQTNDWTPVEAAFRNPDVCAALVPPVSCPEDEEPSGDSRGSALQDLSQLRVTWDAFNLYIAVDAVVDGAGIAVYLDYAPGGLARASALDAWRRALEFGPEIRPDAFLAVSDRGLVPELYLATSDERAVRIAVESYAGAAGFDADATGRALEAALPWSLLFPAAPQALDPEPGAPPEPLFVLPAASSAQGLRVAAAVLDRTDGQGALDVAPDPTSGVPEDRRRTTVLDRAVRVDWDAVRAGTPHFVDFGAAIQLQSAPRFVPDPPAAAVAFRLANLRTFSGGRATRLLLPDTGADLEFAFDIEPQTTAVLYLTASVFSLRGDRVLELYRDAPRHPGSGPPPFGSHGDASRDRWDGRDAAGRPVPGGVYVLEVKAATTPGVPASAERRGITVVR